MSLDKNLNPEELVLFQVLHGSHLYGTSTETSDYDFKAVYLPPLDSLLLNDKIPNIRHRSSGNSFNNKVEAEEVEVEFIPLQKFLDDFFDGQTYALEIVFTILSNESTVGAVEFKDKKFNKNFWERICDDLVGSFLTNDVKKMIAYSIAQANQYGLKVQRYEALENALATIKSYSNEFAAKNSKNAMKEKLKDHPKLIEKLIVGKFVSSCELVLTNSKDGKNYLVPGIDVGGKKFALTNSIERVVSTIEANMKNYGSRVRALSGNSVDWKALSHAIRISEQTLEFLQTGKIKFPRPNADYLRLIRQGKLSYSDVVEHLSDVSAEANAAISISALQKKSEELAEKFRNWKVDFLKFLYKDQLGL